MVWCSFLLHRSKRSIGSNSYNMERCSDFVTMGFAFNQHQELWSIFFFMREFLEKKFSISITRSMNCKGEICTKHCNAQNELVWARLSLLDLENATVEGKIDLKLSWLLFAHSLTLSWRADTRGRPCPSGPPPQHSHSSSWDLLCPLARFWHFKGLITSRAVFLLLCLLFFLQKYSRSFSSTLPASVRNATTQLRLYTFETNPHSY